MIKLLCRVSETQKGKQEVQNPFAVRTLLFQSGERFPILTNSETGEPDFDTAIYVLTHLRATAKASNTIELHLRSIIVLKLFLQARGIDLGERIRSCEMLQPHELDELVKWCRRTLPDTIADLGQASTPKVAAVRSSPKYTNHARVEICSQSGKNRIRAVSAFMDWFVRDRVSRLNTQYRNNAIKAWQTCRTGLEARAPRDRRRSQVGRREGAHPEAVAKLFATVEPSSHANPWKSDHVRFRNQLIVHWLYYLGVRRGELLNIRISDINFRRETVLVVRLFVCSQN